MHVCKHACACALEWRAPGLAPSFDSPSDSAPPKLIWTKNSGANMSVFTFCGDLK